MILLTESLPKAVEINNKSYCINSDFRTAIKFELLTQDDKRNEIEKANAALELFYPIIPEDCTEASNKIVWFYSCGKNGSSEGVSTEGIPGTTVEARPIQIYSYFYDDSYIYAAFLTQYKIDLMDIPYLHWWKFRALFEGLEEARTIQKIMGYRAMKIPNDMPKEQKRYYRKMKQLYRLPDGRTEAEKDKDFTANMSSMF